MIFLTIKHIFQLTRWPNLLIVAVTQVFTRIFLIGPRQDWFIHLLDWHFWGIVFSTVCVAAAGYVINDYHDIKIDLINKPTKVIIGRHIKRRWALGLNFVLNWLGVAIGLWVSMGVGFINLTATFCLWLYSNQLKRLPFWGNLMVAFLSAFSLIVLVVYYRIHVYEVYIYAGFAFGISLIREIVKDLEDWRGDSRNNCKTLPILWGVRPTKNFILGLIVVFLAMIWAFNPVVWHNLILSVIIGWTAYKLTTADTTKDFALVSRLCKIIMLVGLAGMFF
jgi:4-hydroxybenzoate polyprenyltransferase